MHLILATYNVHRCIGQDGRFDPERIAGVLTELDADVVALQEVEARSHGNSPLLEWLRDRTGYRVIPGPTLVREAAEYGNVLLTRGRVDELHRIDLSVPGREPRGAIAATLTLRERQVYVVATHLGLKPAERRQQILQLLERFEHTDTRPAILMGDLNEWFLWGQPLRWLRATFGPLPEPRTFPARCPIFALDRIWVTPPGCVRRVEAHRSPLARLASDHLPLRATLDLTLARVPDALRHLAQG